VVGGADGVPQIYQIFRTTARKIGDNANLLRKFPAMEGRIFMVAYSPDGERIAAASSLDGRGFVSVFSAKFDATIPRAVAAAYKKTVAAQSPQEKEAIEAFVTSEVKLLAASTFDTGIYALKFSPDGRQLVAAGGDGKVRFLNPEDGQVAGEFVAVPLGSKLTGKPSPKVAATRPAGRPK
jgi:WD40 repeat protein